MKTLTLSVITLLFPVLAFAQEEPETLLPEMTSSGGYGAPLLGYGSVNQKGAFFSGGRGGWIINHQYVIGGGGGNLINNIQANGKSPAGKDYHIGLDYGGLMLEYIHNPDSLGHWFAGGLIGGGSAWLKERGADRKTDEQVVIVFEPYIGWEINVVKYMRLAATLNYRLVNGYDNDFLQSNDLTSVSVNLIFKFGKF